MKKKKIVFLSGDYGSGHHSAVSALEQALEKQYPGQYEFQTLDVAAFIGPYIDKIAELAYKGMTMYSKLIYKAYFKLTDKEDYMENDSKYYALLKPSFQAIDDAKPDALIFCYPLLFATISRYLKEKKINAPTFALVTDTGEVHINWVSDDIDYYFVPTKDTGFFLEERGVDHDRIKVFGFPVRQQFYKKFDAEEVKEKYNLPKDKKIVMVFSGAWGSGKIKRKVDELEKALKDTIILVICGKNRTLKSRIRHGGYRHNKVIPVGFLHDVAEFMTMADVVVSKAGGISIMELVTMKKPIVVTEIFPGQEEPNAKFIESMGFGYIEKDPEDLAKRVKFMLETDDLERIKSNYSKYHVNEKSDKSIANFIHEIVGNEEIDADEATQVSETI